MERGLKRVVSRRALILGAIGWGGAIVASEACKSENNLSAEEFSREFKRLFELATSVSFAEYTEGENRDFLERSVKIDYKNIFHQKKVISLKEYKAKSDGEFTRILYLNTHDDPDSLDDPDTEVILGSHPYWSKHIYKPYGERISRKDWQGFLKLVDTEMGFAIAHDRAGVGKGKILSIGPNQ